MGFSIQVVPLNRGMRESLAPSLSTCMGISTKMCEYRRNAQTRKCQTMENLPSSSHLHVDFSAKVGDTQPRDTAGECYYARNRSTNVETTMTAFSTVSSQTRCAQKHCQHKDMNGEAPKRSIKLQNPATLWPQKFAYWAPTAILLLFILSIYMVFRLAKFSWLSPFRSTTRVIASRVLPIYRGSSRSAVSLKGESQNLHQIVDFAVLQGRG